MLTALEKAVAARDERAFDIVVLCRQLVRVRGQASESARLDDLARLLEEYERVDLAVINELMP